MDNYDSISFTKYIDLARAKSEASVSILMVYMNSKPEKKEIFTSLSASASDTFRESG